MESDDDLKIETEQVKYWGECLKSLAKQFEILLNFINLNTNLQQKKNSSIEQIKSNYKIKTKEFKKEPSHLYILTEEFFDFYSCFRESMNKESKNFISQIKKTMEEIITHIIQTKKEACNSTFRIIKKCKDLILRIKNQEEQYQKAKTSLDEAEVYQKKVKNVDKYTYNVAKKEKADLLLSEKIKEMEKIKKPLENDKKKLLEYRTKLKVSLRDNFELVVSVSFKEMANYYQCLFLLLNQKADALNNIKRKTDDILTQLSNLVIVLNDYSELKFSEENLGIKSEGSSTYLSEELMNKSSMKQLIEISKNVVNFVKIFLICLRYRKKIMKLFLESILEINKYEMEYNKENDINKKELLNQIDSLKTVNYYSQKNWRNLIAKEKINDISININSISPIINNYIEFTRNEYKTFVNNWGKFEENINERQKLSIDFLNEINQAKMNNQNINQREYALRFQKKNKKLREVIRAGVDFIQKNVPTTREKDKNEIIKLESSFEQIFINCQNHNNDIIISTEEDISNVALTDIFEECQVLVIKYFKRFKIQNYEGFLEKMRMKLLVNTNLNEGKLGQGVSKKLISELEEEKLSQSNYNAFNESQSNFDLDNPESYRKKRAQTVLLKKNNNPFDSKIGINNISPNNTNFNNSIINNDIMNNTTINKNKLKSSINSTINNELYGGINKSINNKLNGSININNNLKGSINKNINNNLKGSINKSINNNLKGSINKSINNNLNGSINKSINNNLNGSFNKSINNNLNESINKSINNNLKGSINKSINNNLNESINKSINNSLNGSINKSINNNLNGSINKSINNNLNGNLYKSVINTNTNNNTTTNNFKRNLAKRVNTNTMSKFSKNINIINDSKNIPNKILGNILNSNVRMTFNKNEQDNNINDEENDINNINDEENENINFIDNEDISLSSDQILNELENEDNLDLMNDNKLNKYTEMKDPYTNIKEEELNRLLNIKEDEINKIRELGEGEKKIKAFSCSLSSQIISRGTLMITNKKIEFNSSLIKKVQIIIPLKDIISIKKKTSLGIDNSIQIKTEKVTYLFTSFISRDFCFSLLTCEINRVKKEAKEQKENNENEEKIDANSPEQKYLGKKRFKAKQITKMLEEIEFYKKLDEITKERMELFIKEYTNEKKGFFIHQKTLKRKYAEEIFKDCPLFVIFSTLINMSTQLEEYKKDKGFFESLFLNRGDTEVKFEENPEFANNVPNFFNDGDYVMNLFSQFNKEDFENFLNDIQNWSHKYEYTCHSIHKVKQVPFGPSQVVMRDRFIAYFISPTLLIFDDMAYATEFTYCDNFLPLFRYRFDCDIKFNDKKGKFEFNTKMTISYITIFLVNFMLKSAVESKSNNDTEELIKGEIIDKLKDSVNIYIDRFKDLFDRATDETFQRKINLKQNMITGEFEEDVIEGVEQEENVQEANDEKKEEKENNEEETKNEQNTMHGKINVFIDKYKTYIFIGIISIIVLGILISIFGKRFIGIDTIFNLMILGAIFYLFKFK